MIDNSQQIIREHIANKQEFQFISYLNKVEPNVLQLLIDDRKQTIMHLVISDNLMVILEFLEQYCSTHYQINEIKLWVNKQNIEQFAPLHLASYYGNITSVQTLLRMGADPYLKSGSGLLPIHAAAQGDHPFMIKFWLSQGFDINVSDDIGNTCLHWATYQGCDQSVNYLIAWNCDLNKQNNEGSTALHLGATYGQVRIVKKLLLRGALKNIKNLDDKQAIDISRENEYTSISNMLEDNNEILIFCSLRQAFHRQKRNMKSVIAFLFIYLSTQGIMLFELIKLDNTHLCYINSTFMLLILSLHIVLVYSNPGYVTKQVRLDNLMRDKLNAQQICPDCEVIKPNRSRHCEICEQCVIVYDHHCPWINNCIGAKNYCIYYSYLIILSLNNLYSLILLISLCFTKADNTIVFIGIYPFLVLLLFIIPIQQILIKYYFQDCFAFNKVKIYLQDLLLMKEMLVKRKKEALSFLMIVNHNQIMKILLTLSMSMKDKDGTKTVIICLLKMNKNINHIRIEFNSFLQLKNIMTQNLNSLKREKFRNSIRRQSIEEQFQVKRSIKNNNNFQLLQQHLCEEYETYDSTIFRDQDQMLYYSQNIQELTGFNMAKFYLIMLLNYQLIYTQEAGYQLFFHSLSIVQNNIELTLIEKISKIVQKCIIEYDIKDAYLIAIQLSNQNIIRNKYFQESLISDQLVQHLIEDKNQELKFRLIINLLNNIEIAIIYVDQNYVQSYLLKMMSESQDNLNKILELLDTLTEITELAFSLSQSQIISELINLQFNKQFLSIFYNLNQNTNIFLYQVKDLNQFIQKIMNNVDQYPQLILELFLILLAKYNDNELKLQETIKQHLKIIEQLQYHENQIVRNYSYLILDNYYNDLYETHILDNEEN